MKFRAFGFFFKEAAASLVRNLWMVTASVAVVAVSLIIFGISLLMVFNAYTVTGNLESNVSITVNLRDGLSQSEIGAMEDKLKDISGVVEVKYVDKDKALAELRSRMKDKKEILDAMEGPNPLPDQYRVKTAEAGLVAGVAKKIEGLSGVEKVNYGQGMVEKLFALFKWVRWVGYAAMILLGLAAIFLISTTIQLTLFARRKEIHIMKLVGATDWFIRWPYILEGIFIGFVGSLLSTLVLFSSYSVLVSKVNYSLPMEMQLRSGFGFISMILALVVAAGVVIGFVGSLVSIRKYLKV